MPIYKQKTFKDGGIVAVWKITESEDELKALASVPTDEQENINLMPSQRRRIESYAVRALLNEIFENRVYIGYEEDNSPYIKNAHYSISISHSGQFACVYVHEDASVGIDVESLTRNFEAVEKKVLSESEKEFLNDKYKNIQLAIIWSAKEAIYKLMCERGMNFATQIEIDKFTPKDDAGDFSATYTDSDGEKYELNLNYEIFDGYEIVWLSM